MNATRVTRPNGASVTTERVRQAYERNTVLHSDLPFTEFSRLSTPKYCQPAYDSELKTCTWVVEFVEHEATALRCE